MASTGLIIATASLVAISLNANSADVMTLTEEQWFVFNYVTTELIPPIFESIQPTIQKVVHFTLEKSKEAINLASELIDNHTK